MHLPGKHGFNKDCMFWRWLVLERQLEGIKQRWGLSPCLIGWMRWMDGVSE